MKRIICFSTRTSYRLCVCPFRSSVRSFSLFLVGSLHTVAYFQVSIAGVYFLLRIYLFLSGVAPQEIGNISIAFNAVLTLSVFPPPPPTLLFSFCFGTLAPLRRIVQILAFSSQTRICSFPLVTVCPLLCPSTQSTNCVWVPFPQAPECNRQPCFAPPGCTLATSCSQHKSNTDIDVRHPHCDFVSEGDVAVGGGVRCTRLSSFAAPGKRQQRCAQHKVGADWLCWILFVEGAGVCWECVRVCMLWGGESVSPPTTYNNKDTVRPSQDDQRDNHNEHVNINRNRTKYIELY